MKLVTTILTLAFVLSGCGVADVTSGAGELADTGDRLVAAIEDASQSQSNE